MEAFNKLFPNRNERQLRVIRRMQRDSYQSAGDVTREQVSECELVSGW